MLCNNRYQILDVREKYVSKGFSQVYSGNLTHHSWMTGACLFCKATFISLSQTSGQSCRESVRQARNKPPETQPGCSSAWAVFAQRALFEVPPVCIYPLPCSQHGQHPTPPSRLSPLDLSVPSLPAPQPPDPQAFCLCTPPPPLLRRLCCAPHCLFQSLLGSMGYFPVPSTTLHGPEGQKLVLQCSFWFASR